jgi:hypothetical protein
MTDISNTRTIEETPAGEVDASGRGVTRREYDPSDDCDLAAEIVRAVAEVEGVSSTELPSPLYETVDVEALEAVLFSGGGAGARTGDSVVEFSYMDCRVRVTADGYIEVSEADATAPR